MVTKKVTGGTLANNRGRELESRVAALLEDSGYENVHPPEIVFPMRIMDQPMASIDGYDGEITWLSPATVSGRDRSTIYAKAESVTNLASF